MRHLKYKHFQPGLWLAYKPVSMTPLEVVLELKNRYPGLKHIPITYAGRLDPMAEGLLLLLTGKKVHKKEKYLKLHKTYRVTALLGITTDSFDLLGLPKLQGGNVLVTKPQLISVLKKFIGPLTLRLPGFSSPTLQGKPLHLLTRTGKLKSKDIPTRTTQIYSLSLKTISTTTRQNLCNYLTHTITKVHGDFRQIRTLKTWQNLLQGKAISFQTVEMEITCESGTYIRSLVQELGKQLGLGAVVYKLVRTQVGSYQLPK